MSNLWFNIRFGTRHLQIGPNTFRFMCNPAHAKGARAEDWRWFQVYEWFGKAI